MKLSYNPDKDIRMTFSLTKYPNELNQEKGFVSDKTRAYHLGKYIEEQTGIRINTNSFRETKNGVSMDATISNVISKRKIRDYVQMNEDKIDGNDILVTEDITCNYLVNDEVYSPVYLKEDMNTILDVRSSVKTNYIEESAEINVLEEEDKDKAMLFIVEKNGRYTVETLDNDVEEIYEDFDPLVEEDDVSDKDMIEERVTRKKLIRGGKVIIKRKSNRPGYKYEGGREVRMTSKELRDRKRAQMKAARKRKAKMGAIQKHRKKSIGLRTRRISR